MDHARDVDGETRWSREFTLDQAGRMDFHCAYCPTRVFVRRMPNWQPPTGAVRERRFSDPPEFCFAARGDDGHAAGCTPAGGAVAALIAERTVSSRSGPSGAPPGRIVLRAERVTKAGIAGEGEGDGLPRRARSVDDGAEHRQRGPRDTTLSHIRRACEAFASDPAILGHRLIVPGLLPPGSNTYGRVFRSMPDADPGEAAAIWHMTLRFKADATCGRPILFLRGMEVSVSIDRSSWPTMQRDRFDADLRTLLEEAHRLWDLSPRIPRSPTLFALGTYSAGHGRLKVADSRLATVLLLDRAIRRPASP